MSLLPPDRAEHAGEIARGGDGGTKSAADRLPDGCAAEVLVTAGAFGEGNDLHLAVVGFELHHRFDLEVCALELRLAAVCSPGVDPSGASSSRCRFPGRVDGVRSTPSVISSEPSMTRAKAR